LDNLAQDSDQYCNLAKNNKDLGFKKEGKFAEIRAISNFLGRALFLEII
jgi:hypothetical protein